MKKAATITLLILLTVSVGSSVYLLLDQKTKNKLIADKDASVLNRDKIISEITEKHKKLDAELTQATQAAKVGEKEYKALESDRDFLKIKITSAESKLAAQADGSSEDTEAAEKIQEELSALKLEATEKAKQLAALEAKNSSLDAQIADHLKQLQESADALVNAEASLKPFQELGKTPDEIKKDLMKRPVTLSQPLPPRPASQAGKITEPIQAPEPAPNPAAPAPTNQP
jgi:chromosome segregation ATPase